MPILTGDVTDGSFRIATALAEHRGSELLIVGVETVPEQTPLTHPDVPVDADQLTDVALSRARTIGRRSSALRGATRVGRNLGSMIAHEIDGREVQLVVLVQTDGTSVAAPLFGDPVASIFESVECDVVLANGAANLNELSSILVPIAGGPHSGMAVDIAKALATETNAWIELFHVIEPNASDEERESGEQYIQAATDRLGGFERVDTWLFEAPDISEAIVEQSNYYSLTILGAPQTGRLKRFVFGSKTETIREQADSTIVTVRSTDTGQNWFERWLGRTA